MRTPMRDRILQVLVDACPHELRFSDVFERTGEKSRTAFSKALQKLVNEKLIDKRELTRRFVTYTLNSENYKRKLQEEKARLTENERKINDGKSFT